MNFYPMSKLLKKTFIVLLVISIAAVVFITFFLEGIITKTLDNKIEATFGSYYQLQYASDDIQFNGLTIGFNFKDVKFSTDTLLNSSVENLPVLFFEASTFSIQGIGVFDLLLNKTINIKHFELNQPALLILKKDGLKEVEAKAKPAKKSKTALKHISLNSLNILNGTGTVIEFNNRTDTLYSAKDFTLKLDNLQTDLVANSIDTKTVMLNGFDLQLEQVFLNPSFSQYKFLVDQSNLNLKKGMLKSFGIKALPKKSFYKTSLESEFRKTIFNIEIDTLLYESDYLLKLFTKNIVQAKNIELNSLKAYLYENNNIEKEETSLKPLINESINNLPFDLDIDSVKINNGFIEYQFLSKNGNLPASLDFSSLNGHIANIRRSSEQSDTVKLFLESDFMNQAPFTFVAEYPLSNINYQSFSGHIGSLPFSSFEPVFRGTNEIKFKKGHVNNIFFTGIADNLSTSGQLIFDYEDLNIQLISKKHKKQWLKSSLVNIVVRKDGKKSSKKNTEQVDFSYKRPATVGQFGLYARGIMDGLAQVILPTSIYKKTKK